MKQKIIGKREIKFLYCNKLLSSRSIAKIYKCDQGVILRNLRKYGLPVRNPKKKIEIARKKLEELYIKKKLSTYKIARLYSCNSKTIYHKLRKFKITTRPRKNIKISKEKLRDLYFNKRLSLAQIGKIYHCDPVAIFKKMKRQGFSLRKSWETNEKHRKSDFSGNLLEKAYLLGFRAGDLGVRKRSKITGTIHVGCNSTKPAQIKLIKNLFKDYGPVWVSKPTQRHVRSVDTLLNSSFSFLLPKDDKIDSWILRNRNFLAAYIAGYTDAEGNIGIYDNRARFRLGSYDVGILRTITQFLINQKIKAILRLEKKAGTVDKRGSFLNKDFWRITINEKSSLLSLFNLIGSYLRHSDKTRAMNIVLKNIRERSSKQQF